MVTDDLKNDQISILREVLERQSTFDSVLPKARFGVSTKIKIEH